jgi:ribonucleoside-diphosphate reductase alpha chain
LELRKNTGDDRRRTHDMHLANWIPDTFMKRVRDGGQWTLFSPSDVPDLHDLSGSAFERAYRAYEAKADAGEIALFRRVDAVTLWRKMLAMLFETGHPWMTWKDPSNVRSPQDHVGVVHSSNLCTEILLNTSRDEVAVCNLGSINLVAHVTPAGIDVDTLARTVTTAVRMLDNVIDITLYPIPAARAANLRHRPVGLGLMGFQDALTTLGVSYASDAAVQFADESMELISYHALLASSELARERGRYESFAGSKWDRGLLPMDTVDVLEQERGEPVPVDRTARLDWEPVRASIRAHGMRNSNVLAIAPTATIANICDVSQSIEPIYKNVFVKANLSGDFIVVNRQLVDDLRAAGVWDAQMIDDLKFHDGSVQDIPRIPDAIKEKYLTAFEIEAEWLIECAARRQKWIDMGQSLNLYVDRPNGRRLDEMYKLAWAKGLKTTYYLRNVGAGGVEKSTLDVNARGIQPRWMKSASASSGVHVDRETQNMASSGAIAPRSAPVCDLDGTCEACQ